MKQASKTIFRTAYFQLEKVSGFPDGYGVPTKEGEAMPSEARVLDTGGLAPVDVTFITDVVSERQTGRTVEKLRHAKG